jgi:predicted peroxiredoxin
LHSTKRLLIVLAGGSSAAPAPAGLAFRYAVTAAALDLSVEIHVVGESVKLLQKSVVEKSDQTDQTLDGSSKSEPFSEQGLSSQVRLMKSLEVKLFVCSAALADAGLTLTDLIPEIDGVRGAAAMRRFGRRYPHLKLLMNTIMALIMPTQHTLEGRLQ